MTLHHKIPLQIKILRDRLANFCKDQANFLDQLYMP